MSSLKRFTLFISLGIPFAGFAETYENVHFPDSVANSEEIAQRAQERKLEAQIKTQSRRIEQQKTQLEREIVVKPLSEAGRRTVGSAQSQLNRPNFIDYVAPDQRGFNEGFNQKRCESVKIDSAVKVCEGGDEKANVNR